MESIVEEAQRLVADGAKELILIAQDTSRYGWDLYGRLALPELLKKLCAIEGVRWIRMLYCYPDSVTDELLDVMASEEKIVKYMDLPLQHCSGKVLRDMRRKGIGRVNGADPENPGEGAGRCPADYADNRFPRGNGRRFEELSAFVKEICFERLGCFTYSQGRGYGGGSYGESGPRRSETGANGHHYGTADGHYAGMGRRTDWPDGGSAYRGFDRYAECWFGRSAADAPDVDGKIFFMPGERKPRYGEMLKVKITDCMDCDLMGEVVE